METEPTRRGGTSLRVVGVLGAVAAGYAGLRYLARLRMAKKGTGPSEIIGEAGGLSRDRAAVQPVPGAVAPERAQTQSSGSPSRRRRSPADTRSPAVSEHAVVAQRQQAAIDRVGHDFGGQPFDSVLIELRRAFVADGLAVPTRPWLEAVATDIAAGRRFLVGGAGGQSLSGGGEHVVRGEHELWFHPDPATDHIPPGTRTSFGTDDPRANTPNPPEP